MLGAIQSPDMVTTISVEVCDVRAVIFPNPFNVTSVRAYDVRSAPNGSALLRAFRGLSWVGAALAVHHLDVRPTYGRIERGVLFNIPDRFSLDRPKHPPLTKQL